MLCQRPNIKYYLKTKKNQGRKPHTWIKRVIRTAIYQKQKSHQDGPNCSEKSSSWIGLRDLHKKYYGMSGKQNVSIHFSTIYKDLSKHILCFALFNYNVFTLK